MRISASPARAFHGWHVAVGVGVIAFVAWGVGFYQLGVYMRAFHDERGWSLSALSAGTTLFFVLGGLANLATGRLVDSYGPRRVLFTGALLLGVGIFSLGQASVLWHVFVADAVLAVGFACTSTLVLGAVVGRWFERRRALVMTLAMSGAPLGALLLVPAGSLLLHRYGLSTGSAILAAMTLGMILPVIYLIIRDDPHRHGLGSDRAATSRQAVTPAMGPDWTARQAARTAAWWLLTFSFVAIMLGQVAYLVHQVSFLSPIVGDSRAAGIVSITGAFGLIGRCFGGLGDRLPKHLLLAAYCLVQALGVFLAAYSTEPVLLMASAALVGFTMGHMVSLQPLLVAERFGMRSYGTVFGTTSLLVHFGAAFGLSLVGFLADRTGDYTLPFTVTGALALLAAGAAVASGRRPLRLAGDAPRHRSPSPAR